MGGPLDTITLILLMLLSASRSCSMLKVWILVASIYFRFLTLDHCKVLCFALGSEYSSSSSPSDVVIMFFLTTQDCGSLDCITSSVLKDT